MTKTEIVEANSGKTPLHMMSGAAILGLDWALFTGNIATGGLATIAVSLGGFIAGSVLVTGVQRFRAGDSWTRSLLKGAVAGAVVGIPMPIAGTALGGAILGWSGLSLLKGKLPGK
ncbi:MAG: phosphoribosylaminoimidazole carboxylase [Candidatus Hydrogenedentota bacterium]|nr:MAG: phosphoribosylaminoimidazole carboxylase [Candidatus Hydrogenedentota bacterium]